MAHLPVSVIRFIAMACVATVVAACAADQRKRGEPEYDMMENLTARYNIVYHGRKIIMDVERELFASHTDNYQQLLPVLIEPTETTAASNATLMDSVIGKALNIINKKTKSKYINEAYMLTGRANYLKGNYFNAVEFFTYVANTFGDMPEYRQAALVWKARSLMQLGNLTAAGLVLDTVFMGLESERKSRGMAFATQAKHYLLTHDEASAVTMLQQALEYTQHKPTKLRWHYLLGQLLEQQGRNEEAYAHFTRVVRSNAPYEMSFQAGLHRIQLLTKDHSTGEERVRLLKRMLRDSKNKDFRDQIYYQIAAVYYADSNVSEALTNYQLALQQQNANRYQTTLTYLKLADHYFNEATYHTAKQYYDSVGMSLPPDFPDAGAIQRKIANLDELILQLQVVARQDSLQYLAGLDEHGRNAGIDSIVAQAYAQVQASKQGVKGKTNRRPQRLTFDDVMVSTEVYTDNRFYFNNPDAMGMGQVEFRRRWGNRQLGDNWRFSDMGQAVPGAAGRLVEEAPAAVPEEAVEVDSAAWASALRLTYLEALPDTKEKLAASHRQIHDALLSVGNIYRDELRDYEEAAKAYEELLRRYPDTKEAALIYFNLYRIYTDINVTKADFYRDRLLGEFPDSLYAHIVRDPMYLEKQEQQQRILDEVYGNIYTRYTQREYQQVIAEVTHILDQGQGRQQTLSQLAYLRALALGRTAPLDTFEHVLQTIAADFPDDSLIAPLVHQHLAFIEANRDTLASRQYALEDMDESRERFVDEPTMTLWPQLVIRRGADRPRPRKELTVAAAGQTGLPPNRGLGSTPRIAGRQLAKTADVGEIAPNTYRDMVLLPDSATYYFVINVMNARVNLAPSRFGIGQFNRTRYTGVGISHQLKVVNNETQLVYIGPFDGYEQAKLYETRIRPLLPDIMKIPSAIYNTFLITEENFGTLSDFSKIDDYHAIYQEQEP